MLIVINCMKQIITKKNTKAKFKFLHLHAHTQTHTLSNKLSLPADNLMS